MEIIKVYLLDVLEVFFFLKNVVKDFTGFGEENRSVRSWKRSL